MKKAIFLGLLQKMIKNWLHLFFLLPLWVQAQEHLLLVRNMPGDSYGFYALNVNTCEYCLLAQTSPRFDNRVDAS